jgi:hypothetical protein
MGGIRGILTMEAILRSARVARLRCCAQPLPFLRKVSEMSRGSLLFGDNIFKKTPTLKKHPPLITMEKLYRGQ